MRKVCILERQCSARKLCDVLALEPTGHGADSRHKAAANLIGSWEKMRGPSQIDCAALAALSVLALARAAWAQAPAQAATAARLEYVRGAGAEGCPDAVRITEMVAAQAGRIPFDDRAETAVRATVSRDGSAWRISVVARDAAGTPMGERTLRVTARDCRDVTETLAFTLSMVVDALARRAPPEPPRVPARAPPPVVAASPAPPWVLVTPPPPASAPVDAPTAPQPRDAAWQFAFGVDTRGVAGLAAGAAAEVSTAVEMRHLPWSLELTAGYLTPTRATGDATGAAAVLDALRVGLAPCFTAQRLRGCLPVVASRVAGEGEGVPQTTRDAVGAVQVATRVDVALYDSQSVSVRLTGSVAAAVLRASFRMLGTTFWTQDLIEAGAGIAVRYVAR